MHIGRPQLRPIFIANTPQNYRFGLDDELFNRLRIFEDDLTKTVNSYSFTVAGFCLPCNQTTKFGVDLLAGGSLENGKLIPNWRERLVCSNCKMSNRQRLAATLMMQHLQSMGKRQNVYLMECTTSLCQWSLRHLGAHHIVGSEYFGEHYHPGEVVTAWRYRPSFSYAQLFPAISHRASLFYSMLRLGGVQHENVTGLSFESSSLDMIVSNDVFEHISTPQAAFSECARALRLGGIMLATFPFHSNLANSVTRAKILNGQAENLLPAVFHGNPVSSEGALVFTDFGWDVFDQIKQAGFSRVQMEVYASEKFGHLGGGQAIFVAVK